MLSLAERVDRTILRYSLLPPGARVVVALSGGADSTALACLLVDLAARGDFRVVAAAHFNHRLRAAASDDDQAFCRQLAERLGLSWSAGAGDVRSFAASQGASVEEASRRLRYAFLRQAAAEHRATHVAVGHTRDDQAETVLLQLLRGAGPRGLRGMAPERPLVEADRGEPDGDYSSDRGAIHLVRPLIETGHEELVSWLGTRGQAFREDDSNRDRRFLRNRVRHELIPFLESRFSPSVSRVLSRDAEIAASDWALLDDLARAAYERIASREGERIVLDRAGLLREPDAIRRRVALFAIGNLRGSRFVGRDQVRRLLALAEGRLRGPIALPGATAAVESDRIIVGPPLARGRNFPSGMNFSRCALSIPGEARFLDWVLSSFVLPWNAALDAARLRAPGAGRTEAIVDAGRVSSLWVRARRPGDWIRPLGLGGRKKLQDYFVDRKVPRDQRDRVPLVVDGLDRIVWVAGHGIDEEYRVNRGTCDVVILKLRGESA
jgi:tRNA(Ile)-lysidine synthase